MDRITTQESASVVHIDPTTKTYATLALPPDDDDIKRVIYTQRSPSWASDDTVVRGEEDVLLPSKIDHNSTVDFDLVDEDPSYTPRSRRRRWMTFFKAFGGTLLAILLALDILLRVSRTRWMDEEDEPDPTLSRWGLAGTDTEDLAWYPTNFLQDVVPKPIHSHNDYWRKVPLFTALRQGCISVEADVWLFDDKPEQNDNDDTLYVGHERAALQPNRTFQSLYIQPLVDILERQNPTTDFYTDSYRGVFDTNPNQTLTLLVDVKTAGPATWAAVVAQLEPLRKRGWLSFSANGTTHARAVTVVGTGNTPFAELTANATYRDYFFDAPLHKLGGAADDDADHYDATNSYYASVSFGAAIGAPWMGALGAEQVERIRRHVAAAHARGLQARYFDLPSWPVGTRNRIWDLLVKEGVDMLNVDDVKSAAKRKWKY
ncbi:unnamed protein product [Discula destructiva]